MFDWYEPIPTIHCPACDSPLSGWQGKDSDNALLLWRQGELHPVDQLVDEELKMDVGRRDRLSLPDVCNIYTECSNRHWIHATVRCDENHVWYETIHVQKA